MYDSVLMLNQIGFICAAVGFAALDCGLFRFFTLLKLFCKDFPDLNLIFSANIGLIFSNNVIFLINFSLFK
jgi:hypothetical protein